ncbi:tyrosine-type recombinase/integrase [Actinomadura barringtoniae]|uniref:Tyrosine-type recombinase/integrase n=1 Tax=Actinomadura barringtoniae TaxID=1427535 RepID=A0A939PEF0_9ACTN|nr:tyrosine-type recombinase/integrase [Actinomadura barringtoniae]MBO2448608.1 tyrosine-type recombinase/integrase [Actinomadura barringtoniae]
MTDTYRGTIYPHRGGRFRAQGPERGPGTSKICATWNEAVRFLRSLEAKDLSANGATEPWSRLITAWLADYAIKETTRHHYESAVVRFVCTHPDGALQVNELKPLHVDRALNRAPTPSMMLQLAKPLHGFFDWCEVNDYTTGNLYRRSQAEKMTKRADLEARNNRRPKQVWTAEQFRRFWKAEKDPVRRDLWWTLATTATRDGEGIGLTWPNVQLDHNTAKVADNLAYAGKVHNTGSPKNGLHRDIYLGKHTVAILRARQKEQEAYRERFEAWDPAGWVFDRRRTAKGQAKPGIHLHPNTVMNAFNRLQGRLALPCLDGPHGLRRTWATLADRELGIREAVRRRFLGQAADTHSRYTIVETAELLTAATAMEELLLSS